MESFALFSVIILLFIIIIPDKVIVRTKNGKGKENYMFLFFSILWMWFLTSFRRYDVGNDTVSYLGLFQHILNKEYFYDSRVELLFRYLTIGISKITSDYTDYLCITSFLMFYSLYVFIKNNIEDKKLFIAIFWLYGFTVYISPLRQTLALAIVLVGLEFVKNKKYFLYIICVIIASFFHSSAIVLMLIPFFCIIRPRSNKIFFAIILLMIMITTNGINIVGRLLIGTYYSRYLGYESGTAAAIFNAAFGIIPILMDRSYDYTADREIDLEYTIMRWSSTIYAGFYLLSLYSGIAGRMGYYFLPLTIGYWCKVLSPERIEKKSKNLIIVLLIMILVVYRILVAIFRPNWNSFFPFYFVWQ